MSDLQIFSDFARKYRSNCHTHTDYCDGKISAEAMAKEAFRLNFVSLGFTGHSPLPYDNDWAMKQEDLPSYLQTLAALREEYKGKMEILSGIELDADSVGYVDTAPFSLRIASLHTLHTPTGDFPVDVSPVLFEEGLQTFFDGDPLCLAEAYYAALTAFQTSVDAEIVGHFDLLTKYNKGMRFIDETDPRYRRLACNALDAIAESCPHRYFEVNTGVLLRAGKEVPYPAPFLMERLHRHGSRVVINADAHRSEFLAGSFDTAAKLLYNAGYREVYRARENGFEKIPL